VADAVDVLEQPERGRSGGNAIGATVKQRCRPAPRRCGW
jgi:hypothetical protein